VPIKSLEELKAFNLAHADRELPWFGQELVEQAIAAAASDSDTWKAARAACLKVAREDVLDKLFAANKLDALVAPTGGPAWKTDLITGHNFTGGTNALPAIAGYPSLTVPAGSLHGLPLGVSFFGAAWSEPTLLGLAFAYEQESKKRVAPTYPATIETV
jgi:amidase